MTRGLNKIIPFAAGLVGMSIYLVTVCPTFFPGDSPELASAAFTLGIAHPPGYPLFCLIGKLFSFLPAGPIAFRLNLLSVFFSASTVFLLALILEVLAVGPAVAFSTSLIFAFSRIFWSQALIGEVYGLHIFFIALTTFLLVSWIRQNKNYLLLWLAFAYGLSITNHHIMLGLGPVFAGVIISVSIRNNIRIPWAKLAGLFVLGVLVYLYLPGRSMAHPAIDWGETRTPAGFLQHLIRKEYGGILRGAHPGRLPEQLWIFVKLLTEQFSPGILPFMLLGLLVSFRHRHFGWFSLAGFFVLSVGLILFLNFNPEGKSRYIVEVFFTSSYFFAAVWLGLGLQFVTEKSRAEKWMAVLAIILPVLPFAGNFGLFHRNSDVIGSRYGQDVLSTPEPGAVIFCRGDNSVFPMLYFKKVEKLRPDVTVYDESGSVFENIYGTDVRMLPQQKKDRVILDREMEIIKSGRHVYCLPGSRLHQFFRNNVCPSGLLYRVGSAQELADGDSAWKKYRLDIVDTVRPDDDFLVRDTAVRYYYALAEYCFRSGKTEPAMAAMEKAEKIGFDIEEVQFNLAALWLNQGRPEQAKPLLLNVIKIVPDNFQAYANLGLVYYQENLLPEAHQTLHRAVELNPYYADALSNLGAVHYRMGDIPSAEKYLRQALEQNPDQYDARYNLGVILWDQGKKAEAETEWRRVLEIMPGHPGATSRLKK